MSLYPQHTQPPYPSAGYPPRGPAPYQQQPQQHYPPAPSHPVQPPVYRYADPHAFRRDYDARLGQLTENSRPIIQALSIMAQDYLRWADVVAESIEAHIRQVSLVLISVGWPSSCTRLLVLVCACTTYRLVVRISTTASSSVLLDHRARRAAAIAVSLSR
jgi:hypothetical protein